MSLSCMRAADASLKSEQSIYCSQSLPCANVSWEMLLDVWDAYTK